MIFFFFLVNSLGLQCETQFQSLGWKIPEEENGYPFQQSCMENLVDRGVWSLDCGQWDQKESDTTE